MSEIDAYQDQIDKLTGKRLDLLFSHLKQRDSACGGHMPREVRDAADKVIAALEAFHRAEEIDGLQHANRARRISITQTESSIKESELRILELKKGVN